MSQEDEAKMKLETDDEGGCFVYRTRPLEIRVREEYRIERKYGQSIEKRVVIVGEISPDCKLDRLVEDWNIMHVGEEGFVAAADALSYSA